GGGGAIVDEVPAKGRKDASKPANRSRRGNCQARIAIAKLDAVGGAGHVNRAGFSIRAEHLGIGPTDKREIGATRGKGDGVIAVGGEADPAARAGRKAAGQPAAIDQNAAAWGRINMDDGIISIEQSADRKHATVFRLENPGPVDIARIDA